MKSNTTVFISDIHLGSRGCNYNEVLYLLRNNNPSRLVIVGDFIDGWLLKKRMYWKQQYTDIINRIIELSNSGTEVIYITGNHDDFLRDYTSISPVLEFGNIKITDSYILDGHIFVTHGDMYDGIVKLKWLGYLGSIGYETAIRFDRFAKRLGYKFSLSKYLKNNVKEAVSFITDFENQIIYQAKKRNCDTVIAGHIHTPGIKNKNGITYLNCGDFIENNSYITMNSNGKFKLKYVNLYNELKKK